MQSIDIYEIAQKLYSMASDMDAADYEETKNETIEDLEEVLITLKCIAYTRNHYKTFLQCLETITQNH